ncbi:MAG TPA: hypothetical protein VMH00_10515 [Candidatus Limnocylindrales bacterium]|nr:hypothetical protein [Candidatus Limnocylindrales bacterium]
MEVCGKEIWTRGRVIRVAFLDGEGYQFLQDPEAALKVIRESGQRIDLFTFTQRLSDTTPRYSYPMEWDNMAAMRVSTYDDWMKALSSRVRTIVRKTVKDGIVVREASYDDAFVQGIYNVYNESPVRQGRRFWHYGKDLETVRAINGTFMDQSVFIGAYLDGEMIGFIKMVTDENRTQAGLMQILSMIRHRDKAPTNALVAGAVRSCTARGIQHLWYTKFSFGTRRHDSLAEFKRRSGFQKVDIPRYYIPLTALGRMALRLGLHHTMLDLVPEPVVVTYRKIRGFWYAKKFPGPENA